MKRGRFLPILALSMLLASGFRTFAPVSEKEELLILPGEVGRRSGRLVVAERSEPKTFNPVTAVDNVSRSVINLLNADLIHINRETHLTEPGLAKAWEVSADGRRYTLRLRRGICFSDGEAFDADDVVFTFQVYLDENIRSPQRDLLIIGGKPIEVLKVDSHTVVFQLPEAYGAGERIFDRIAMLPRHLLEEPYRQGKFVQAWGLASPAGEVVGLGPFRLKKYVPGERVTLERNPHYWKADREGLRLPYLDEMVFLFVPSEEAQVMRFQAGETHLLSRIGAENYSLLESGQGSLRHVLRDLGPGLEYNFLFFNLNILNQEKLPGVARKQVWFREVHFRRAVSAAIDRQSILRLVYQGRATPLWTHVTPGNKLWVNRAVARPDYSLVDARQLLRSAGFNWKEDETLVDPSGQPVEFSILTSAGNTQRAQIATIIQEDLRRLGMRVQVVTLEFRALIERVFDSRNYEACLLALASGDVDPTAEMSVWLSKGSTHLWHLGQAEPASPWEAEIDRLMQRQMTSTSHFERKLLYDRVQQIVAEQLPLICLASPHMLVGADTRLGNFRPAILDHYTLWNAEQLFFRQEGRANRQ